MAPSFIRAATLALRASSTTFCPASPTCPQDDQCSYASNGVTFQVSCGTDYYGGDLSLAQTSTLDRCMDVCAQTSDCVAASYVGQNCYMKSTLNSAQSNINVIGVAVTSRPSSPASGTVPTQKMCSPNSFTCPQNDGCSITDQSRTFTLACGTDFYGGDLSNQYADSLQACTDACASNAACVAASFVGGSGSGTCYLKSVKNAGSSNDNVDAIYVAVASTSSSSSAQPSTSSSPSSSPSSTSSSAVASSTDSSPPTSMLASPSPFAAVSSSTPSPSVLTPSPSMLTPTPAVSPSAAVSSTSSSATPSPSTLSRSSTISSSSSTSTPAAASSTSSTTPATAQPINFCLRVTTAGSSAYGLIIRSPGQSNNLQVGTTGNGQPTPVVFFNIDSTGRLLTAAGNSVSVARPFTASNSLSSYSQETINRSPSTYAQEYCTVSAQNQLECTAQNTQYTWTLFSMAKNSNALFVSTASSISSSNVAITLGVYYGNQCIEGSSI
ncbi:hypothetical protein E8E13_008411 [Curvularia kusanoi]|uniref:Apple domain-containing protein n=1 Tax=Curvularia kusanoi TaxID=90978 RepID=A0A9P4TJ69_CURKU|nr:hypothetical protein E8E13_008411 [Curvularia kusanoi]